MFHESVSNIEVLVGTASYINGGSFDHKSCLLVGQAVPLKLYVEVFDVGVNVFNLSVINVFLGFVGYLFSSQWSRLWGGLPDVEQELAHALLGVTW